MFRLMTPLIPFVLTATAVAAQDRSEDLQCKVHDRNEMVLVLLCPEGLEAEQLSEEGRAACNGERPCGAWVWTAEDDLPAVTPHSHDLLRPETIARATAIWVDEEQRLILLEKQERQ